MNILVVEDEQHSREELLYLLGQLEPNAHLEQRQNAMQAWERLERSNLESGTLDSGLGEAPRVDVVFLDVQMPGMNGLELAARIARLSVPPRIVFATANPQHALTAFDLEGVDYVLKPYRSARLAQTLERIRKLGAAPAPKPAGLEKIWAARGEVGVLLDSQDILYCQANGDRVTARTGAGETLPLRFSLQDLETRFPAFARVHKSFLVNLNHVREIEPFFSGSYRLRLSDDTSRVPLSRQYAKRLREHLGRF